MKKYFLLLLLLPLFICHGMTRIFEDNGKYYYESFCYDDSEEPVILEVPSSNPEDELLQGITLQDPEKILNLKKKKSEFEESLKLSDYDENYKFHSIENPYENIYIQLFDSQSINNDPTKFVKYIYYQVFHAHEDFGLNYLREDSDLLTQCKEARINGYSALGAAIIAKIANLSLEAQLICREGLYQIKSELVKELVDLGFEPTEDDKDLAYLELYERSVYDIKRRFIFASGLQDPQNTLLQFPLELVKYIASFVRPCSLLP